MQYGFLETVNASGDVVYFTSIHIDRKDGRFIPGEDQLFHLHMKPSEKPKDICEKDYKPTSTHYENENLICEYRCTDCSFRLSFPKRSHTLKEIEERFAGYNEPAPQKGPRVRHREIM